MSNSQSVGIDLGTTFSSVGTFKGNKIEIVAFPSGERVLPSHVYFDPKGKEIIVGEAAKFSVKSVGHTIYDSKRFIGAKFTDKCVQDDIKHWPFKVVDENGFPKVEMEYDNAVRRYSPEDISTIILKEIKKTADVFMGKPLDTPTKAVITVPAYFNNAQRECTKRAAENANLSVISIINEPTAAAIAYAHQRIQSGNQGNKPRRILIYDYGGGTFDVSIIELDERTKQVKVLCSDGDPHLGGEDIDNLLVTHYVNEYRNESGSTKPIALPRMIALRKVCEKSKCLLSSTPEVYVDSEFLDDAGVECNLTRAAFDDIMNTLFNKTIEIVRQVLTKNNIAITSIDDIVCVGGSSRIPKVQELLKQTFPKTNICQDINANEVVAYGATIAANISGFDFKIVDVVSHSLSTDVEGDKVYVMIPKNTPLPCSHTEKFGNAFENQTHIDVKVFEGEGQTTTTNTLLADFSIDDITPSTPRSVIIKVTFSVDTNGILTVTGQEERSGRTKQLTVNLK